jgi:hypothetical protein
MLYGGILMDLAEFQRELIEIVGKGCFCIEASYWFRGYYDAGEEPRHESIFSLYILDSPDGEKAKLLKGTFNEMLTEVKKLYEVNDDRRYQKI